MMEWNEAEGEGTGWMDVCMYVGCGGVTYQYWEVRGYGVRRWRGIQYSFFFGARLARRSQSVGDG